MSAFLLLVVFLAVAIPLGLALCSQPQRGRTGVGEAPDAEGEASEPGMAEVVDALVAALRMRGDEAAAVQVDRAFYGAATGGELVTGMRSVLETIDRRELQGDVSLLMRIERFLSEQLPPGMAAVVYTKKVPASPRQKRLIQERAEAADDIADGLIRDEKARQREAWIDGS